MRKRVIKKIRPSKSSGEAERRASLHSMVQELGTILDGVRLNISKDDQAKDDLLTNIEERVSSIGLSIKHTATGSLPQVKAAVEVFRDWMLDSVVVRVIGAGRARLAGSIPANRLAHGGARVYIVDDIIPMPHSIKGGGIIAVSASGETESVLTVLKNLRAKQARVKVIGIAKQGANEFAALCDLFIGIRQVETRNPLTALADTEEYVISMLLDAMVVAAGKLAGFDDTKWRLGHEDIGPTGPYQARHNDIYLPVSLFDHLGK